MSNLKTRLAKLEEQAEHDEVIRFVVWWDNGDGTSTQGETYEIARGRPPTPAGMDVVGDQA